MNVIVPYLKNQRYYTRHITYILNLLQQGGASIVHTDKTPTIDHDTKFDVEIDGKKVIFDFADHFDRSLTQDQCHQYTVFRMHYNNDVHTQHSNFFPFSPISWYDWNLYEKMCQQVQYKACGTLLNKQRPYGDAVQRRNHVQRMLKLYDKNVDVSQSKHEDFLLMSNCCLTSVCVPGANNNMLDIGQGQYMSLGVCTISPVIKSIGSWNVLPLPSEHYIQCADDYSDLIDKIEWIKHNPQRAVLIGLQAKRQFSSFCTPQAQTEWVHNVLQSVKQ